MLSQHPFHSLFKMIEQSAPFTQFSFIFKLFGFQPKLISRRHKQIAALMFILGEVIYGLLIFFAMFQVKDNPTYEMKVSFQSPYVMMFWLKIIHIFVNFEKMEKFKKKMSEVFNDCDDGNFNEAFGAAKRLSLFYFLQYLFLTIIALIVSWSTRTRFIFFWKLPIDNGHDLFLYLHWFEEFIGVFYNVFLVSVMDMYPFCIMILLHEYLSKLTLKFRSATNKEEFFKCVNKQRRIKGLIQEFQDIFSPLLFIQAFTMIVCVCVFLLILTSTVSFQNQKEHFNLFASFQRVLETYRFIIYIVFALGAVGQLLMLAFFGNSIESASDEMTTAIYESDWIESNVTYKKTLLLTMINLKVPIKVKALKIFEVNLPNFVFVSFLILKTFLNFDLIYFQKIVKTAYSLFNLLRSLK
jgi:7tm Odorant receptor